VDKKFTQASVQAALRRDVHGFMVPGRYRDHAVLGLALIVGRRSARWVYSYKPHGINPQTNERWSTRDLSLGAPVQISLPEARAAALRAKSQVQHGEDPHRARMLQVEEAVVSRAKDKPTIATALAKYRDAMLEEPTSYKRTEVSQAAKAAADIIALKGGSRIGKAAVEAIDLPALKRWARTLPERNAKAKLRWGAISRFLEWCVDEDLIEPMCTCAEGTEANGSQSSGQRGRRSGCSGNLASCGKRAITCIGGHGPLSLPCALSPA
jgi:hypothetical protein